jgi:hypothetical protein
MEGFSGYSVDDNGTLYDEVNKGNRGKAIGCGYTIPSGAIGTLICGDRYWSKDYPEGPFAEHAVTLLALLHDPLVKRCWYLPHDEWYWPPAVTSEQVHAMLDDFMRIGPRR